jgi:hypothetical protein
MRGDGNSKEWMEVDEGFIVRMMWKGLLDDTSWKNSKKVETHCVTVRETLDREVTR